MRSGPEARLVLSDGTIYRGRSIGARGEAGGEVVFNTSLSGYQEVLTDPSYRGQIVAMTYPLIGNYGIAPDDDESPRPWLSGFVVRELSRVASNFRSREPLGVWLERHGIVAIEGVDTRALTLRIRKAGAMKALLTTDDADDAELLRRLEAVPELVGRDLVSEVTRGETFGWEEGYETEFLPEVEASGEPCRVTVIDYGAKANIMRSLVASGFEVTVLPATASSDDVLGQRPDGVLLSNGPGDPRVLESAVSTVRGLVGRVPIFGICLGHQILGAAVGARLFKLKFGHHGGNQPVKDLRTGKVEITAQNHGFAVDPEGIEQLGGRVTHVNLNDQTVEGMEFPDRFAMSVQYHPEAAPGPHDSLYLFRRFRGLVQSHREAVR